MCPVGQKGETMYIIQELQRTKAVYVNRYKRLYADYISAPKLSDEAKGRYIGRIIELSYILIDLFGMDCRELQQMEDLIKDRYERINGGTDDE